MTAHIKGVPLALWPWTGIAGVFIWGKEKGCSWLAAALTCTEMHPCFISAYWLQSGD
jgi:hypothetical protein